MFNYSDIRNRCTNYRKGNVSFRPKIDIENGGKIMKNISMIKGLFDISYLFLFQKKTNLLHLLSLPSIKKNVDQAKGGIGRRAF